MIEKYIQQSSLDESPLVRTITGDCMANMCKDIFELIDGRHQMLALTLMLPLPMDDDANVKAAGCRALGVFILFPSVRQNPYFVSDIITAVLEQMMDKSLLVRVRASWAQGNLCDAMVLQRTSEEFCFPEWISVGVWRSIMTTATNASMDNDKLRSNAVRAMGSLLQITPKEYFADGRNMQLIKSAMGELIKNMETGALKTRWNACHAASNLLKNEDYPIGYMSDGGMYQWTEGFYHALVHSLNSCKNFKVRINSCLALATPTKREFYGDQRLFNKTVEGVLKAWDACQDGAETEFQEYRYREQLKHQLMITLRHLKDWMSKEDLDRTHKILNESTTIE
ncbi:armadillo-type protein [Radiomyces spectabilis]|uniref:armadillo-type protein n=1 Tax=Radiomyces spectabilis TaxID=64574 RepID=UPI0022211411|nr:armadillo-type protein [Radiomyces spectabilis]KAI8379388.1 armadillo-type protein [Radiomyces spectabilis]